MEWLSQRFAALPKDADGLTQLSFTVGGTTINPFVVLKAIAIIGILIWLSSFAVRVMDRRLRRVAGMRPSTRTLIMKIFQIIVYCIVFIEGMQLLGISLTALSVFGGALGVGIGFGLQKIASNFISGIILLFEKSIESGDILELPDGTVGIVRLTSARYTLLEMPDGREIMIPNEEFISQRVTSWTHSSKAARVQIEVGIAYESDFHLARELMLAAANAHPKRLKDHESVCVLTAFTDSSVTISLYFWVADVSEGRMKPKSDVMLSIINAFRANNINIPFPIRDVRLLDTTPAPMAEAEPPPTTTPKPKSTTKKTKPSPDALT